MHYLCSAFCYIVPFLQISCQIDAGMAHPHSVGINEFTLSITRQKVSECVTAMGRGSPLPLGWEYLKPWRLWWGYNVIIST